MSRSVAKRVQEHRAKLRASGMRPVQIWVPDTRRLGFADECRRQSRLLHEDPHETETLTRIEAVSDTEGWSP